MPLLAIERPVWQRLRFAVALGVLSMCAMVLVTYWTQQARWQRTEAARAIVGIPDRVDSSLLRSRMATRDLLAGGDHTAAAMLRESAQTSFQEDVDLVQQLYDDHPALLDAALKLRDFFRGPLAALQARYFSQTPPSLLEYTAYDNLHYPELKKEQEELLQTFTREAEKASKAELDGRKSVETLGMLGEVVSLAGLLAALLIGRNAISSARAQSNGLHEIGAFLTEIKKLAADGQAAVNHLRASAQPLEASSERMLEVLSSISGKAERISAASDALAKIAEQNNLLSLNAAIEAEKAGEYGLAFAVVAMEIRRLSDQTAELNEEIHKTADEIRKPLSPNSTGLERASFEKLQERLGSAETNFRGISAVLSRLETGQKSNG